jgi:DNA-binding response OmpR family regulator
MSNILLIEDEELIGSVVVESLTIEGYNVTHFLNGLQIAEAIKLKNIDLVILDIMLPIINGYQIAKEIRNIDLTVPIIFLSAKVEAEDVVKGFEVGAEDYIRKPFSIDELLARINAVLKRNQKQLLNSLININGIIFNVVAQTLQYSNKELVQLTHKESELLYCFYKQKNMAIPKTNLLLKVWGVESFYNSRTLDMYISKLRKYFSNYPSIQILNLKGIGYKLVIE